MEPDACALLSDAQLDTTMIGTYGSAQETLLHLFAAEEGYARAFNADGSISSLISGILACRQKLSQCLLHCHEHVSVKRVCIKFYLRPERAHS